MPSVASTVAVNVILSPATAPVSLLAFTVTLVTLASVPGPGSGVGVGVGVTGLSDTSGILSPELDVSIVLLSVASILFTVPSPVTSEPFAVDVDVIVSTFASAATSTLAVAVSESSTFPTLALSFTATSALALSLTCTFSTFALSFTFTAASPSPTTYTSFTFALPSSSTVASVLSTTIWSADAPFFTVTSVLPSPFNTMSFASPVTSTLSTDASAATSTLALSPASTVFTFAPSAISTGACASTLLSSKPTIFVATFANTEALNALGVRVLITTLSAPATVFLITVIVPLTFVLPSK